MAIKAGREGWYFCLKCHQVEQADEGHPNADRLGPYETRDEAERALQIAADRTEAWDTDPEWNDD